MRILVDILHPAHVHFFRPFHGEMAKRGHEVWFAARDKDCAIELLDHFGLPYQVLSRQREGALRLATEFALRTGRLLNAMRSFKPDVLTGIMGPAIAIAGKLARTPAIVFYDTETAPTNLFTFPLAHRVCTPRSYSARVRGRHVTYDGYHELAYLHPSRFKFDPQKLAAFGIAPGERYSVVRFVSWQAIHDFGKRGLSAKEKLLLVEHLQRHGRVVISSEGPLPESLEHLRASGPIGEIHQLLAGAQLFVGESATMASESTILGTPSVFMGAASLGTLNEQARLYRWARTRDVSDLAGVIADADDLLAQPPAHEQARQRVIDDTIDVTGWMVDYFEGNFQAEGQ